VASAALLASRWVRGRPASASPEPESQHAWLQARWDALMRGQGAPPVEARRLFDDVCRHYQQAHRHYHNLSHIESMLKTLDALRPDEGPTPALSLAAWFHDLVYDPRASDNEARSADYAREALRRLELPEEIVKDVADMILATQTHSECDAPDCRLLLDADLAILGAPPSEYERYADAIRREYAHVPEPAFVTGRGRVLRGFLERERIYRTDAAHQRFDGPARRNLAWELERLQTRGAPLTGG
jgi:predicted metal-dependent HD superfamily phosphohydrolase